MKLWLNKVDYSFLTALIIPLVAILPLVVYDGLPNTADGPIHLMRQVGFDLAWAEGNYYPRWGFDLAYGHGMPIFSYAPPSLYFLTQFVHFTGLTLDAAMKTVVIFGFMAYSAGIFLFVRRVYGPYSALVAATVHSYAPYRLREAYIQGNYGQFTGLACYAFIVWGFHGLITDGGVRYWLAAPLSLAMLLLSHNISSMIIAPMLAAYLVVLLVMQGWQTYHSQSKISWQSYLAPFFRTIIAGLLGLGLAAIFWLPAFGERHDIKLEGITQDFFDFRENFITLDELLSPPVLLDFTAINPKFPLSLGLAQTVGAMMGLLGFIIYLVRLKLGRLTPNIPQISLVHTHTIFFIGALLYYGFLMLPPSEFLWTNIPLLELTEFPWRMLGPAIFCASILSGAGFFYLTDAVTYKRKAAHYNLLVIICSLIVIILNLPYLYPSQFIAWGNPTPADSFQYEIDSGAIGTTSTGEFLPRTAQQHPKPETFYADYQAGRVPSRIDPRTIPEGATVDLLYHQAEAESFRISSPVEFVATLRLLHWPGWHYYLNHQPTEFTLTENTGLVQITIPPGENIVTAQLENTTLRNWGKWLSLISVVILTGLTLFLSVRTSSNLIHKKSSPTAINTPNLTIIFIFFLLSIYLISRPLKPMFIWQSDPNYPNLADQVLAADFADQIRLVGMDTLSQQTIEVTHETTLPIVLYWRALQKLNTNYAIFVHLDTPLGETIATVDEPNPEFIPSSKWAPGMYLRNPLQFEIPAGLLPIRYNLNVGVYHTDTGERLSLAGGDTVYKVGEIWGIEPLPNLPAESIAQFGQHIELRQAQQKDNTISLIWQTTTSIEQNYSIFVHLLDAEGTLIEQVDGVPYQGLYPLPNWLPNHPILDTRTLPQLEGIRQIVIGIYDPATGQRLPAVDEIGQPLPNDSYHIAIP